MTDTQTDNIMKSKVHFSRYCVIITIAVLAALSVGIIAKFHEKDSCILLSTILIVTTFAGLYYCPMSVTVEKDCLRLHRLLSGDKCFKISDIKEIDTCYPSAGGLRLCGSGGFFGYWGYFSDIMIGQYFGYYGDRSQCFYVKLKNGRQYVLSCENHTAIVKATQKMMA